MRSAVAIGGHTLPLTDFVNLAFGVPFGVAAVGTVLSLIWRVYRWLSGGPHSGVGSVPAICLVLLSSVTLSIAHAQGADDATIRRILEERIDTTTGAPMTVAGYGHH
jgi:hypothetical protein